MEGIGFVGNVEDLAIDESNQKIGKERKKEEEVCVKELASSGRQKS